MEKDNLMEMEGKASKLGIPNKKMSKSNKIIISLLLFLIGICIVSIGGLLHSELILDIGYFMCVICGVSVGIISLYT